MPSNSQSWWPSGVLDDLGRLVREPAGEPALEHVGRLDQVVVDRDHRVPDRPGSGSGSRVSRLVTVVTLHSPPSDYASSGGRGPGETKGLVAQDEAGGGSVRSTGRPPSATTVTARLAGRDGVSTTTVAVPGR